MDLKNKDLSRLKRGLDDMGGLEDASKKFSYLRARNLEILNKEIEHLNVGIKEYYEALVQLNIKFAKKDKDGKPIIVEATNSYDIPGMMDDSSSYSLAVKNLKKKHHFDEYEKLLEEPVEKEFTDRLRKIHINEIPDSHKPYQFEMIFELIKVDDDWLNESPEPSPPEEPKKKK